MPVYKGPYMNEQENALQEIKRDLERVKTLLENLPETIDLKLRVYDEKIAVANHRIEDLEEQNRWLWRAIVGTVISCAIAVYFR